MRFSRLLAVSMLLALAFVLSACAPTEQEKVWADFTKAVSEKRVDDALKYIDFERMVQKTTGDDPDAQAAMVLFGGQEGTADWMKGLFREGLSKADVKSGSASAIETLSKPESVKTEGDYSTLVFKVDGDAVTISMERIDGAWKIVDFGDAFNASEDSSGSGEGEDWPGGPGTYVSDTNGTKIKIQAPAPSADPMVSEIEAYRARIKAADASYLLVEIDNTQGKEQSSIGTIEIVTDEGKQVAFSDASGVISDWFLDGDVGELYNEGVELSNKYLDVTRVLPGASSQAVFIALEEVPSVKSVWLDGEQVKKAE